jgi:hypothetical protein
MRYFKTTLLLYIIIILFSAYACSDMSSFDNGKEVKDNDLFSFNTTNLKQAEHHTKNIKSKSIVSDVRIAEITSRASSFFKKKQVFNFNVSPTEKFQINTTQITENSNGTTSLVGEVVGSHGSANLVLTHKGITGTLRVNDQFYRISPTADDLTAISKIDHTKFPQKHPKLPIGLKADSLSQTNFSSIKPKASPSISITTQSSFAPNGGPTLGVLVLYTQAVDNSTSDITGLIQLSIDETNQTYANSNLTQNVYLAHSEQTSYNESGRSFKNHTDALDNPNDGMMDNVASLRNQYNADKVILLVTGPVNYCGRANSINATKNSAFAAVRYDCSTSPSYALPHEIGHLLGARHNRYQDNSNTPYKYGHGYVDPNNNWHTIMAYSEKCGGCPTVPYWSNPDINYPPTGQAMGTSTYEDNARAISNRKYEFRDFYTLDNPDNVHVTNWSSPGQHPIISWDLVSGQSVTHKLLRCVSSSGNCVGMNDFYTIFQSSSSTSYQDQVYNVKLPCFNRDDHAYYRVVAQNHTGLSYTEPPEDVCVEM